MRTDRSSSQATIRPASVLTRLLVFGALWWALTEGDTYNWWLGAIMVLLATATSVVMLPPLPFRPLGAIRFLPFFIRQSVKGGTDVARRAFNPALPLDPGFMEVALRLPEGPARVVLAITLSLLPGTVSVELRQDYLRIHALDRSMPIEQTVRAGEERMAAMFATRLRGAGVVVPRPGGLQQ